MCKSPPQRGTNYTDAQPGICLTSYNYRIRRGAGMGPGNLSLNYSNIASATSSSTVPNFSSTAYGMNEGSGTTLADASGTGHTGTLVNGPAWVAGQATYGQALSFDGLDDAVSVANPATYNFGTADFTIELWAKRTGLGGSQRHLFSKCHSTLWQSGCEESCISIPATSSRLVPSPPATPSPAQSPIRTGTMWP